MGDQLDLLKRTVHHFYKIAGRYIFLTVMSTDILFSHQWLQFHNLEKVSTVTALQKHLKQVPDDVWSGPRPRHRLAEVMSPSLASR